MIKRWVLADVKEDTGTHLILGTDGEPAKIDKADVDKTYPTQPIEGRRAWVHMPEQTAKKEGFIE